MTLTGIVRFRTNHARRFATSAIHSGLGPTARSHAEKISTDWKGTSMTGGTTKNFIGGQFVESKTSEWIDVLDPVGLQHHHIRNGLLIGT